MLPISRPIKKMRRCIHCNKFFMSSSAAERVCSGCRRKHNKLLSRYGGVTIIESTPQMRVHMESIIEEEQVVVLAKDKIDRFLDGDTTIDDSAVYAAIKEDPVIKITEEVEVRNTSKVISFLDSLIEEAINVKDNKVKEFYW